MMAMMILPVGMILGWVVLCSRPVQCRLWMPALFWAVTTIPNVKKVRAFATGTRVLEYRRPCFGGKSCPPSILVYGQMPQV